MMNEEEESMEKPWLAVTHKSLYMIGKDLHEKECEFDRIESGIGRISSFSTRLLFDDAKNCLKMLKKDLSYLRTFVKELIELDTKFEAILADCSNNQLMLLHPSSIHPGLLGNSFRAQSNECDSDENDIPVGDMSNLQPCITFNEISEGSQIYKNLENPFYQGDKDEEEDAADDEFSAGQNGELRSLTESIDVGENHINEGSADMTVPDNHGDVISSKLEVQLYESNDADDSVMASVHPIKPKEGPVEKKGKSSSILSKTHKKVGSHKNNRNHQRLIISKTPFMIQQMKMKANLKEKLTARKSTRMRLQNLTVKISKNKKDSKGEEQNEDDNHEKKPQQQPLITFNPVKTSRRSSLRKSSQEIESIDETLEDETEIDTETESVAKAKPIIRPRIIKPGTPKSGGKAGIITCSICNYSKEYASARKRLGAEACDSCFFWFWRFLKKPRQYYCLSNGTCKIEGQKREQADRCCACWLRLCLEKFDVEASIRKLITEKYSPKIRATSASTPFPKPIESSS